MRIIQTINDLKNVLVDSFCSSLNDIDATSIVEYIMGESNSVNDDITKKLQEKPISTQACTQMAEVIMQLRDYKQLLKNIVEILLNAQNYEQICAFVNKLFVAHIGDYSYNSREKSYSLEERYFDRFVEIIKYCDIKSKYFLPFFLAIFKSEAGSLMYVWKEPLKEYLKLFVKNSEKDFMEFLSYNNSIDGLEYFLEISTVATVSYIINNYLNGTFFDNSVIGKLLTKYKSECFNELEKHLSSKDEKILSRAIDLLAIFKGERQVDDRAMNIYENTNSEKVKQTISKVFGYDKYQKFGSLRAFELKVQNDVNTVQERLYGLRLTKYYQKYNIDPNTFDGKVMTFVMDSFKTVEDSNVKFLYDYFSYVSDDLKSAIANIVYETAMVRDKLNKSKWAIRLICSIGDGTLLNKAFDTLCSWYGYDNEAWEYMITCIVDCKRPEYINLLKKLNNVELINRHTNFLNRKTQLFATLTGIDKDYILDGLCNDYGLDDNGERIFELPRRNLVIKLTKDDIVQYNQNTGKPARIADNVKYKDMYIKEYLTKLRKTVISEKKRFIKKFYNNKTYHPADFNYLIKGNNLLKVLAQNYLWGKYRDGKLYEIFELVGNREKFIMGGSVEGDYAIGLVHPLEIKDKINYIKERTDVGKEQLSQEIFDKNNYSQNAQWIDSFAGKFVDAQKFVNKLKHRGYRINDLDKSLKFTQMVKPDYDLNLLTEVVFEEVGYNKNMTTTISVVRFYKLNTLLQDKNFILNKSEALSIGNIDSRTFSNEMSIINECSSNE